MRRTIPSALAFGLLVASARAQTGRHLPALESFVAIADRAFTGRVVRIDRSTLDDAADFARYRYRLTVRVERNLRGKGDRTVVLEFTGQNDVPADETWVDPKKSYLWSIVPLDRVSETPMADEMRKNRVEGGAQGWLALDLDHAKDDEDYGRDGRFHLPIFAEDLSVVRTRDAALARLAAFARAHPKPLETFDAMVFSDFVRQNGIDPNAYLIVSFPKDPVAQAAARAHRPPR